MEDDLPIVGKITSIFIVNEEDVVFKVDSYRAQYTSHYKVRKQSLCLIEDYSDGKAFDSHPLFSVRKNAFQLFLYFNELEVCNQLGSRSKIHKLGKFGTTYGLQTVLWVQIHPTIGIIFPACRHLLLHPCTPIIKTRCHN